MKSNEMKSREMKSDLAGTTMPALFVGHGSPMNLVSKNIYTESFLRLGQILPKPSAILCISAHWLTPTTEIILAEKPKQIFDFHGFPNELYQIIYSPNGSPELAAGLSQKYENMISQTNNWGIDHGAWSVLYHMYPEQNIPVVQLSLSQELTPLEHLQLARQLKFLRQSGVMILGSGNIVHNLQKIDWHPEATPHSWALEFEEFVLRTIQNKNLSSDEMVEKIFNSPHLRLAHPSIEHLLPLIYILGVAEEKDTLIIEARGIQNAAISMATIQFA